MKKEKIIAIYCIENIINNEKYVGQTQDLSKRWGEHIRLLKINENGCTYLQRAWNKYGGENFIFYIVKECEICELNESEIFYIKEFHSHCTENGYNISWGGDSPMSGRTHDDQAKEKMSKASKGKLKSEEAKKNMSRGQMGNKKAAGRVLSKESHEKMSKAQKGSNNPRSKLNENDVLSIKKMFFDGKSSTEISKEFGLTYWTIHNIEMGKSWRHVIYDPTSAL